jgi:adenine-specific DNA methylase
MKYMGSKRAMLRNGLSDIIEAAAASSNRIVDLFTGSGAVAWHLGERIDRPVLATDLQLFAVQMANAILSRTRRSNTDVWLIEWFDEALERLGHLPCWKSAIRLQRRISTEVPAEASRLAREMAEKCGQLVCQSYGGYYFSPWQALWIDGLRQSLPRNREHLAIARAALIQGASRAAAAPGHTAQPFKPNATAGRYLLEAWQRDIPKLVTDAAVDLGQRRAMRKGEARVGDAEVVSHSLSERDLVFLDPPYSGVHYSRFYHVLETIARGEAGVISGVGRYPPAAERPVSEFSLKGRSEAALANLLKIISAKGASAILTFPAGEASNGLSGSKVQEISAQYFSIDETKVATRFSTMGGNTRHRAARLEAHELILTLKPRW